jgi:hypothetical protein
VFDKVQSASTQVNDPGSIKTNFLLQNNVIYRGKARVVNGLFTFDFIVPKDFDYQFGNGKVTYYTEDGKADGNGFFANIIIRGSGDSLNDKPGTCPELSESLYNKNNFLV